MPPFPVWPWFPSDDIDKGLELDPTNGSFCFHKGLVLFDLAQYELAVTLFTSTVTLDKKLQFKVCVCCACNWLGPILVGLAWPSPHAVVTRSRLSCPPNSPATTGDAASRTSIAPTATVGWGWWSVPLRTL